MVFPASSQATGNDGGLEYGTGRILRVMTLKESLKDNLDVSTDMKIEAQRDEASHIGCIIGEFPWQSSG